MRNERYYEQREQYIDHDQPPNCRCLECGELCEIEEETFDYSGTHCTGGKDGVHHTGHYVSVCCDGDYEVE